MAGGVHIFTTGFAGSFTGTEINGTLTLGERVESPGFTPRTGSATYTVTLR
jgi:hypothetical protein